MPAIFADLAGEAAAEAGFDGFVPDACLINRYEPGTKLSLHQDRNEKDFGAPIVSVSLGLPAVFLFGGPKRTDRPLRIPLDHGDIVVWGGPSRLFHHGVMPLADGHHPRLGRQRLNLTLQEGPVRFRIFFLSNRLCGTQFPHSASRHAGYACHRHF